MQRKQHMWPDKCNANVCGGSARARLLPSRSRGAAQRGAGGGPAAQGAASGLGGPTMCFSQPTFDPLVRSREWVRHKGFAGAAQTGDEGEEGAHMTIGSQPSSIVVHPHPRPPPPSPNTYPRKSTSNLLPRSHPFTPRPHLEVLLRLQDVTDQHPLLAVGRPRAKRHRCLFVHHLHVVVAVRACGGWSVGRLGGWVRRGHRVWPVAFPCTTSTSSSLSAPAAVGQLGGWVVGCGGGIGCGQ